MDLYFDEMTTPFGPAAATVNADGGLVEFTFLNGRMSNLYSHDGKAQRRPGCVAAVAEQVAAFFERRRTVFDLKLAPVGTEFQKRVWRALCDIPSGETIAYQTLATRLGDPKATRAVGLANGRNPIALIIPCHRVIGKNGSLTGYGGGIELKRALLDFERPTLCG